MPGAEFPIEITPEAAAHLERTVARKGEPGQFVRLGVKGGGCSGLEYVIRLDAHRIEGDAILSIGQVEVVCDPKSARFLQGARLVLSNNLIGGGLVFENPNADRSCGCGTSFTPKVRPNH